MNSINREGQVFFTGTKNLEEALVILQNHLGMIFHSPLSDESRGTYGYRGISFGFCVLFACRDQLNDETATYVLNVVSDFWVRGAPKSNIDDHLIKVLSRSPFQNVHS